MRNAFAFCSSLFADRSGVAASRFLVVAAACVILLCFSAESCKSHCNGGVRVSNAALATKILDFGTIHFPFKIPFKKCFKIVVFLYWRRDPVLQLRVAIFNCWNLKDASHDSFVFKSSTFGISRKHRTKGCSV